MRLKERLRFVSKTREAGAAEKQRYSNDDKFGALQRIRLRLEAIASENLSGTVYFELGDTKWGHAGSGGAVGADGTIVELKNAYIDWAVPEMPLKFRMGLQGVAMPNAAGGSAVFDDDVAGVVGSYQINENVGVTLSWLRPLNDNYAGVTNTRNDKNNYLDNMDLIALSVPFTYDGIEVTPWLMYGILGQNALRADDDSTNWVSAFSTSGYQNNGRWNSKNFKRNSGANTGAFWFGLPVKLSLWDPLNIEFDFNYGYMASQGRGDITRSDTVTKRFSTKREGWLAKALVEYKMDWGTPGIFGWYASGDDDNPKNGSERMPSVSPCGNFTSILGDGNWGWGDGNLYDRNLSYSGTWGVGLQVADMSFIEDLKHTFRVALWGGTNAPKMAKYASSSYAWTGQDDSGELYLTTNDHLLEFNLVNSYKLYENFEINLELGYVVNMVDHDTWKKANNAGSFEKQDMYKAQLIFAYTF